MALPLKVLIFVLLGFRVSNVVEPSHCSTWMWFNFSSGECECGEPVMDAIQCKKVNTSGIVFAMIDYCVSWDNSSKQMVAGTCKYKMSSSTYQISNRVYAELPQSPEYLSDAQCGLSNREGLLCGKCKKGFAPSLHHFETKCVDCAECIQNNLFQFFLAEILPLTLFFLIIVVVRMNIIAGPMLGYVIFCQAHVNTIRIHPAMLHFLLSNSGKLMYFWNTNILLPLSSIWNLSFSLHPSLCYSCHANNLTVISMQYLSVFYMFFLLFLLYVLDRLKSKLFSYDCCKVIRDCFNRWRRNLSFSDSIIHVFATLTALVFAIISFQLISTIFLHDINGTVVKTLVEFEPAMEPYSLQHIPYVMIAYVPLIIFGILPALILCLYPNRHCQRILVSCCGPRKRLALSIFVDTIYSGYKDGLDGGRDYRRLYPLMLIVFVSVIVIFSLPGSLFSQYFFSLYLLFSIFVSLFVSYFRPCKTLAINVSLSFHIMMIGLSLLTIQLHFEDLFLDAYSLEILLTTLLTLPHALMLVWMIYYILHHLNATGRCYNRTRQLIVQMILG